MKTVIAIVLSLALTGCGTISGMGRDIAGASDWTKEKLFSDSKSK